nr:hypothetical protein CFP56_00456 [Quercus suber]
MLAIHSLKMSPSLENLPPELVENIVSCLSFDDTTSLRLSSRTLATLASQRSFLKQFDTGKILLTEDSIRHLIEIMGPGRPANRLQHCTISAIAMGRNLANRIPKKRQAALCLLLTEAFTKLRASSRRQALASLCLRVDIMPGSELKPRALGSWKWRDIWHLASITFEITMKALLQSGLTVDTHLDCFGTLRGCSLSEEAFWWFMRRAARELGVANLRCLTASLSPSVAPWTSVLTDKGRPISILRHVMDILSDLPMLQCLDLHWHEFSPWHTTSLAASSADVADLRSCDSYQLAECCLRGLYISEENLLCFLQKTRPKTLKLVSVSLVSGTWRPIFDYITGEDSLTTFLYLDDLFEGGRGDFVHYQVPGLPKFPYAQDRPGPSTLLRDSDINQTPILYRLPVGEQASSLCRHWWYKDSMASFGPIHYYDFRALSRELPAEALCLECSAHHLVNS